jgi:hypothetical protein
MYPVVSAVDLFSDFLSSGQANVVECKDDRALSRTN